MPPSGLPPAYPPDWVAPFDEDWDVQTNLEFAGAEEALVAAALWHPDRIPDLRRLVSAGDFRADKNARAWAVIEALDDARRPVDPATFRDECDRRGWTKDIATDGDLDSLWRFSFHTGNEMVYAQMVRDRATYRDLAAVCAEVQRDAADLGPRDAPVYRPPQDAGEDAIGRIAAVLDRGGRSGRVVTAAQAVRMAEAEAAAAGSDPGLMTGFPVLDSYLGGMRPGELLCLGARPGVGKSALALQIADLVGEAGRKVLLVSLEMTKGEVLSRQKVRRSRVPNRRVKAGRLTADEAARLLAARDEIVRLPLHYCDDPSTSADDVAADARRLARGGDLGLVVVDYLQLLRPRSERSNRSEQVADMSRRLKLTAKAAGVPVLMLSQLNRASEEENRPPRLSDLRESGSIEQDCDVVMFLHRTTDVRADLEPVDLIVAKQRNGMTGTIRLEYDGPLFEFREWAP